MPMPRHTLQRFPRRGYLPCREPHADRRCLRDVGLRTRCQCLAQKTETRRRTARQRTSCYLGMMLVASGRPLD